jgi:hypothetical protein
VTPQENAAGPEIFLEVFNQSTGVFEIRDRVFAESQGTVSDNGNFKHKRLYGFEKFVGRQNIDLTGSNSVTTDIEGVLNAVLPTGYVADVPSGATVPTVNNYRFEGRRDQVFKDLRENYNFIINFTAETDGSGNYLVKFEPRGFGGIVDTFEKGVDPVFFDKWTKGDELRRITRAEVIGTDSNNNKVSATASTNPDNGRFIRRNIGYVNSNSEAQDIAINLIAADSDGGSPQSTEHGRVTAPIDRPANSNLNASIQILNDEISVDDSFTVVQQKDFFHQSQTQYSFEFEKELESRERRDKKDLGNRNSELITEQSSSDDLGNIDLDSSNTDTENVAEQYDADSQLGHKHDVSGKTSETGNVGFGTVQSSFRTNFTMTDDGSDSDFNVESETVTYDGNIVEISGFAETDAPNSEVIVELTFKNAGRPFVSFRTKTDNSGRVAITHTSSDGALSGETFQFVLVNESGSSFTVDTQELQVAGETPHDHTIKSETDRAQSESANITIEVNNNDSDANDTSQLTVDGQTVQTLVNILTSRQDKTNR